MAAHELVNGLTLSHQGTSGMAMATLPDVCKTPSPGGPVPVPYPNISRSADLAKGTKTVTAQGKSIAVKGSEFSRSQGDEPGTAGGLKSSTQLKEATWLSYSFDVKFEGKNACRLGDKMLCNHGNTACLGGELDEFLVKAEARLIELANECDQEVNARWDQEHPHGPKHSECTKAAGTGRLVEGKPEPVQVALGRLKEDCMNEKIPDEKGFTKQQKFKPDGTPITTFDEGHLRPDLVYRKEGQVLAVWDFKFPCPSGAGRKGEWRKGQLEAYQEAFPGIPINLICPRS